MKVVSEVGKCTSRYLPRCSSAQLKPQRPLPPSHCPRWTWVSSAKLFCQILRQDFLDNAQLRPWRPAQWLSETGPTIVPPRRQHCWEVSKLSGRCDRLICGTGWGWGARDLGAGVNVGDGTVEQYASSDGKRFRSKPSFKYVQLHIYHSEA